ncbi:MAG: hypothetical protein GY859_00170, partial [Desulfobacterales bacterium]|nr:hypothetical protein [Desulfobacterales bacterium]
MKKIALWLMVALAWAGLAALVPAGADSGKKTVVVTGAGQMYKNDVASARERAISMGLVAAVDRIVAERMPAEDRVRHFETLNTAIYGDISAYILGYKVLTEGRAKKRYHVLMEAAVSDAAVARQLAAAGLLHAKEPLPVILLLITERDFEEGPPRFWWNEDPSLTRSAAA